MEAQLSDMQGRIAVHIESTNFSVAPGGSVTIPIFLFNQGSAPEFFQVSVQGIPGDWVSVPSPMVRVAAREQREVVLTVRPLVPQDRVGRHRLAIRVASQERPEEVAQVSCTLTVAALEVPGRIGVLLPAVEFSVVPGGNVTIAFLLFNQGLEGDVFALSVDGIPSTWVSTPSATGRLSPGQQQEVSLTIQPPRSAQTHAGRHPFRIQVGSQLAPGQVIEAECILTIAAFTEFSSELQPQRVEAGEPARVTVENRGNVQRALTLTWQSPDDELVFEPGPTQELPAAPGEMVMAEFRATPRKRPFFGGEVIFPFMTRVQAADVETQNLKGEVAARALIPSWVLPAALILILVVVGLSVLSVVLERPSEAVPTEPPPAELPPEVPTEPPPEVPTEPPPEVPTEPPPEVPTEPPPEVPTEPPPVPTEPPPTEPPPVPTEPPPTEPPPEVPTEPPPEVPTEPPPEEQPPQVELPIAPTPEGPIEPPPEEPGEPGRPCPPIALGLVLVPLLAARQRGQR